MNVFNVFDFVEKLFKEIVNVINNVLLEFMLFYEVFDNFFEDLYFFFEDIDLEFLEVFIV